MSRGKKFSKIWKMPQAVLRLKGFLVLLEPVQRKNLSLAISASNIKKLRPTVYLSSGGKFSKYLDFLRAFTYEVGYVPIHPIGTLGYYVSSTAHNHNKLEVMKDCFSLMLGCEELWVFDEKLPAFETKHSSDKKHISEFPEGVLAEIYFWLTAKPNSPIRFFTWVDVGIPKYTPDTHWALITSAKKSDSHPSSAQYPMHFGIIDLGSSTVKLTVCNVDADKTIETLHKKSITVNLAEGFFETNILQPLAMERALQAIVDCQKEALTHGVLDIELIGTGIARKAHNLDEFMEKIKDKTGLELKVLSDKDEARLIYEAVADSFQKSKPDLIVVNVGGGSMEIVFGNKQGAQKIYSLPLGISDINEKFLASETITLARYQKMKRFILEILKKGIEKPKRSGLFVYTGGELDYMIITGFPLEDFNLSLAHPKKISLAKFKKHAEKMRKMTREELRSFMPANPRWMDGAIASNTILESLAELLGTKIIIPSNKNLNDGVLLSMIE